MKKDQVAIFNKLTEIAKLKKELLQLVVPEKTYQHFEVIGREVKALIIEAVCDLERKNKQSKQTEGTSVIKKVTID